MGLSKANSHQIYFDDKDYLRKTLTQIKRDFDMSGVSFDGDLNNPENYSVLYKLVNDNISKLIHNNNIQFKNLLYRIDISELTIHKRMGLSSDVKLDEEVSKLIIERCLLKVLTREKFSG